MVAVLDEAYHDREFCATQLPALIESYAPAALQAADFAEERAVVHGLLGQIPSSHLALYSRSTYRRLMRELRAGDGPTLGMALVQIGGWFYISGLLEGGPAEIAGLRRGDRLLAIDGAAPGRSVRLDWRSDDAWLDDPVVFELRVQLGDRLQLRVASHPGQARTVAVTAETYSAWRAAVTSQLVIEAGGLRFGYLHLWYMHERGCGRLLRRALRARFADCSALLLDLRGRGGSVAAIAEVLGVLRRELDGRSLAVLIDAGTRSAKEVLAFELRESGLGVLVGEQTAGAVLPAAFRRIGEQAVLMLPAAESVQEIERQHRAIEGCGVLPDLLVADPLPFAGGADPIRDAAVEQLLRRANRGAERPLRRR